MTNTKITGVGSCRPRRWVLLAVSLVAAVTVSSEPHAAGAAATRTNPSGMNTIYPRTSVKRQGVPFRTRGYLSDACLQGTTDCGPRRPEATAQSHVIREISRKHNAAPVWDDVEWEVAPDGSPPGTQAAAQHSDNACAVETRLRVPVDNLTDVELSTSVNAIKCSWRVDVMVDDGASLKIVEVRRWRGPATRTAVDSRLTGYLNSVSTYVKGFNASATVARDTELNVQKWSKGYRHQGKDFCVWADRDPRLTGEGRGNVYFAEYTRTPEAVRKGTATGGDGGLGCASSGTPGIDPQSQSLEVPCQASWQVTVDKSAAGDTDLRFDFGDGVVETQPIPAGTGSAELLFYRGFSPGQYRQMATVVVRATGQPLGAQDDSVTACTEARPQLAPAYQYASAPSSSWIGNVQQNPATAMTVEFSAGDGSAPKRATIPEGDEVVSFLFSHTFNGSGRYEQTAKVAETGATSEPAVTSYSGPGEARGIAWDPSCPGVAGGDDPPCNSLGDSSSFDIEVYEQWGDIIVAVDGNIRMNISDGVIYPNRDLLLAKTSGGDATVGVVSNNCYYTPNPNQQVADDIGHTNVASASDGTHVITGSGRIPAYSRAGSTSGTSWMICAGAKPELWKGMITIWG